MRKTNTRVLCCSSCFAFSCPRVSMASSSSPRFSSLTEEKKGNLLDWMLDAVLVDKKQCGREDRVVHKNSISDNDWSLIKTYFSDVSTTLDTKKTHAVRLTKKEPMEE